MDDNKLFGISEQLGKYHVADPGNMVGDLISRQAAIDAVSDCGICIQRLLDLPPAQQWIPCKERLPEKDGEYLVTMLYFGEKTVEVDKFSHYETDDEHNGEPLWVYGYDNVIAWMPLPEPWEGKQNE